MKRISVAVILVLAVLTVVLSPVSPRADSRHEITLTALPSAPSAGCGCGMYATVDGNAAPLAGPRLQIEMAVQHQVKTAHYDLFWECEKADAEEAGRVLEAAWPQYKAYFGAEPKLEKDKRLKVMVFANAAAWAAQIQADGTQAPGGAGGYYWPGSKTAYLYHQGTRWFTRTLLLHEALHQFHFLACTGNENPKSFWYTEGIAEHVSRHAWDGKTLSTARVPVLSLEDAYAKALEVASKPDFSLAKLVAGEGTHGRPEAMALVAWLSSTPELKKKFGRLREAMDRKGEGKPVFERTVGKPADLQKDFVAWLAKTQEPMIPLFQQWDNIGEAAVRGISPEVWSWTRLRDKRDWIEATVNVPASGTWQAGLVLGTEAGKSTTFATLNQDGTARVQVLTGSDWGTLDIAGEVPAAKDAAKRVMRAERRDGKVRWLVDGAEVGSWDDPGGHLGLCVFKCSVTFSGCKWEGFPAVAPAKKPGKGR